MLYDPENGACNMFMVPHGIDERLQNIFRDIMAAGANPAEAAFYMVEMATTLRCEETLNRKFKHTKNLDKTPQP